MASCWKFDHVLVGLFLGLKVRLYRLFKLEILSVVRTIQELVFFAKLNRNMNHGCFLILRGFVHS